MRTEEELKQIGIDLYRQLIFTSLHISENDLPQMLGSIFLPLMFMDEEGVEELKKSEPYVFFGYLSQALPRGINGYPMFCEIAHLNKEEWEKVKEYARKLEKAEKEL